MKIKVIDLINKIDNKEELPQKVKFEKEIYEYDKKRKDYINKYDDWTSQTLLYRVMSTHFISELLECEVEIIEDKEELKMFEQEWFNSNEGIMNIVEVDLAVKINELIKAVKQLDKNIKELR